METKTCSKCKQTKPISNFAKNASKKDGTASYCKQCMSQYAKVHHPEYRHRPEVKQQIRQYSREYQKRDYVSAKIRNYHRAYYQSQKQKQKRKIYRLAYMSRPEASARKQTRMKMYRQRPDIKIRAREYVKQRYHKDIEKSRERGKQSSGARRAMKKGAPGKHTAKEFVQMCQLANNKCVKCGMESPLQRDHIIPLTFNGCDCIHNIQPLCGPCNSSKRNFHSTDYRPKEILDWLLSLPTENYRCANHSSGNP